MRENQLGETELKRPILRGKRDRRGRRKMNTEERRYTEKNSIFRERQKKRTNLPSFLCLT
jgi:hypothetical protein